MTSGTIAPRTPIARLRELPAAVVYSLLFRCIQVSAGFLTIPLVLLFLTPAEQGYYYTFLGIAALQSFLELGFAIVITMFAAHEWHHLSLSRENGITGSPEALSRLSSLVKIVFRYFSISAGLFLVFSLIVGYLTLDGEVGASVLQTWTPLSVYLALTAIVFWLTPVLNIIEGCNQVAAVARFRSCQILLSYTVMWVALAAGAKLWALPTLAACQVVAITTYLGLHQKPFLRPFQMPAGGPRIDWKQDLLPMQWRIGVQGLFSYFSFPFYTTFAFWTLGAVTAGRVGLTLQLVSGIQTLGLVAISARGAEFGLLAAASRHSELRQRCRNATALAAGIVLAGFAALTAGLWGARHLFPEIGGRVLGIGLTLILALGVLATLPVQGIALFLRAHKIERLTVVGLLSGVLYGAVGAASIHFAGELGLVISYLAVTALFTLPMTVYIARKPI
jgi:hypothetical protein